MIKVLIVIDNIFQYEKIKLLISKFNLKDVKFIFKHSSIKSAIWFHEDFNDEINSTIDVKNQIQEIISEYNLVISVHCFQFFPKELVNNVRCINIHPGYNPINRGWYPQVFAIINDLPIGATIHEMDEKLDHGSIIAREFVPKFIWDTSLTIYNRVLDKEIELFESNFESIIYGTYEKLTPEGNGNIFSKSDFEGLCEFDLNEKGKFGDFYNKLRALSHGEYKNAFFIDSKTKNKIYFKIDILND